MALPQPRTGGRLLEALAQKAPAREAIVSGRDRITYGVFWARACTLAKGLLRLGVSKGDHVALLASNRPEWLVTAFACAMLGAPVVAISTWARRVELEYGLRHSGAVVLITLRKFLSADYLELLREVCPEIETSAPGKLQSAAFPRLREVIVIGEPEGSTPRRFEDVEALGQAVQDAALHDATHRVNARDMLFMLYTSGTTSTPKGVMLAHYGCIENGFSIGERQHLTPADRLWLAVPLFWSFGSANAIMALMTHGGTIVLQERFDPGEALRLISAEQCTVYYGMPHMARAMLEDPSWGRLRALPLRTGLTIGTPEEVAMTMRDLGVSHLCNVYGATETYGNASVTDAHESESVRLTTQGTPLPGMTFKFVDPQTRKPLPPGEVGEICVRGYVTPGYYNAPEQNAKAFDEEGFFITGDLGFIDADGRVHFRGRLKDMIKSGGINISPLEVEEYLMTHPKVLQAFVIGVPDPVKGEVPIAVIELRPGEAATAGEIQRFCRDNIASYKIPVSVMFRKSEELPRTSTGKVQRVRLRDEIAALIERTPVQREGEGQGWGSAR